MSRTYNFIHPTRNRFVRIRIKHTQTHSTRLVALTGGGGGLGVDLKRNSHKSTIPNNIPLPMQPTTLIKIEDCSSSSTNHHQQQQHQLNAGTVNGSGQLHQHQNIIHQQLHRQQQQSIFEPCHSNGLHSSASTSSSISSAVQTNDMVPTDLSAAGGSHHLFYQADGNLIQIAPHNGMLDLSISRPTISPMTMSRCLATPEAQINDTLSANVEVPQPDGKFFLF